MYWTPIMCGWEWFPDNKGTVSGLIIGGFGFGAFIYGFVSTAIVNPDDASKVPNDEGIEYYPAEIANRVPKMYRECLISWVVLAIAGVALIQRNPEYVQKEKEQNKLEQDQIEGPSDDKCENCEYKACDKFHVAEESEKPVTFGIAWKTIRFWHLAVMFYAGVFYGVYIAAVYKTIATGIKDSKLTLAGALGAVCNGCSRIFWATLQDKIGFKAVYLILLSI